MPKMTKITWHIYKNIYLSNKIMLSGIFWVLFTEKIKNKLLGYHFLEKSYCEDNHRTIFEKSKKRKLFSQYIDYWLHDENKKN